MCILYLENIVVMQYGLVLENMNLGTRLSEFISQLSLDS